MSTPSLVSAPSAASTAPAPLRAPFPYFGGKSRAAGLVWARFGAVRNYVEPFAGSLAVLLARPTPFHGTETVNDADGFICNFWRAVAADPEAVAHHASWPVLENDLHARHAWLVGRRDDLTRRLEGDPEWFDAKAAGWWAWGACCWIGGGWCSGKGPWNVIEAPDGARQLVRFGDAGKGVKRRLVHLSSAGMGVNCNRVHLGNAGKGERREPPARGDGSGRLLEWMAALSDRFRFVRVCSGDWSRVCGPTPTVKRGLTAVFLDPPYADTAGRDGDIYAKDSLSVAHAAREWAVERGDDPRLRICLAGYDGAHAMPDGWSCVAWKAGGGYGSQGNGAGRANAARERLWFSPHCLNPAGAPAADAGRPARPSRRPSRRPDADRPLFRLLSDDVPDAEPPAHAEGP